MKGAETQKLIAYIPTYWQIVTPASHSV